MGTHGISHYGIPALYGGSAAWQVDILQAITKLPGANRRVCTKIAHKLLNQIALGTQMWFIAKQIRGLIDAVAACTHNTELVWLWQYIVTITFDELFNQADTIGPVGQHQCTSNADGEEHWYDHKAHILRQIK